MASNCSIKIIKDHYIIELIWFRANNSRIKKTDWNEIEEMQNLYGAFTMIGTKDIFFISVVVLSKEFRKLLGFSSTIIISISVTSVTGKIYSVTFVPWGYMSQRLHNSVNNVAWLTSHLTTFLTTILR